MLSRRYHALLTGDTSSSQVPMKEWIWLSGGVVEQPHVLHCLPPRSSKFTAARVSEPLRTFAGSALGPARNIHARDLLELGRPKASAGDELGFDGLDAGGLDILRQQPGTPVYTNDFDAEGVRRALSKARKDRTPDWRATAKSPR
jgi:hypothetical protein